MQSLKNRSRFFGSPEAEDIKQELQFMMASDLYNTKSSFSADVVNYPDNLITFSEKHMNYLNAHPQLDAGMYIANLRLMTLIR